MITTILELVIQLIGVLPLDMTNAVLDSSGHSVWDVVGTTVVICTTVFLGICAVGFITYKIIQAEIESKKIEIQRQREHELEKIKLDNARQEAKSRYDGAWRFIEHIWKIEQNKDIDAEYKNFTKNVAEEACKHIKSLWGTKSEAIDPLNEDK